MPSDRGRDEPASGGIVPRAADIFPGDATEATEIVGAAAPAARIDATRHRLRLLAVLSALMGFASISTDLYLPAMPTMAKAFRADTGTVELTVSGYLVGFSLGQLLWGPLGDRYGRRGPVAIGLVLFVIGSAGCALAGDAWTMIAWRIVQAIGACASVVLARAMVRDLYQGVRAAQMMSTLMTVMAIAPLIGPFVGGQILALAGWRAIFWVLVAVGLTTLAALFTVPETLPLAGRNRQPLGQALAGYADLIRDRRLIAYAGAGGFFYAGIYAYVAGTPFAFITVHHVPPRFYGVLFAVGIVGIMVTNMANSRLVARHGGRRLLVRGAAGAALAGLMAAAASWSGWGGLAALVIPLFLFVSATGFIVANSIAGALANMPERAGAVSALVGSIHYGSGIIGAGTVGLLADGTPLPMGFVIALAGVGSFVCATLVPTGVATKSSNV